MTRAAEQATSLIERLTALGAEPLVVPLIEIVAPTDGGAAIDAALARLADYEWVVVTSPNGAARVASALSAVARGRPMVAAVGTATAALLPRPADLVPERQTAEALGAAFPSGWGRVLIAQAEVTSPAMAEAIAAKGWSVEAVAAYKTEPVKPAASTLLSVLSADAVLFASGSAVRSWVAAFGTQTPAVAVAIGPSTAEVADNLGLKIDAVAADHSVVGLVGALLLCLGLDE